MEYLSLISIAISTVLGLVAFLMKRELERKDKEYSYLDERIQHIHDIKIFALQEKVQHLEIFQEKLSGKIDTLIELMERLEKKMDNVK